MAQDCRDGDGLLSGSSEFGPVLGDGRIQVDLAAIGEEVNTAAGQRFRAREDAGERIVPPRLATICVSAATPEVDGELAIDPDGHGGADFVALVEVRLESVADTIEPACA